MKTLKSKVEIISSRECASNVKKIWKDIELT
jgi:hypothetical protein